MNQNVLKGINFGFFLFLCVLIICKLKRPAVKKPHVSACSLTVYVSDSIHRLLALYRISYRGAESATLRSHSAGNWSGDRPPA